MNAMSSMSHMTLFEAFLIGFNTAATLFIAAVWWLKSKVNSDE